jgi:type II secretory pathway pseudopilin PulG
MLRLFGRTVPPAPRSWRRLAERAADSVAAIVEGAVYFIGPLLILLALGIASLLTYTWASVLVPMWLDRHRVDNGAGDAGGAPLEAAGLAALLLRNGAPGGAAATRSWWVGLNAAAVAGLLFLTLFNYWHCVRARHAGPEFDAVVRELADATSFRYPETPDQLQAFKRDFEDLMVLRIRRRRERALEQQEQVRREQQQLRSEQERTREAPPATATVPLGNSNGSVQHRRPQGDGAGPSSSVSASDNGALPLAAPNPPASQQQLLNSVAAAAAPPPSSTPAPAAVRRWMLLGPYEWGYCGNSRQPKPPRSHYDHVSRTLVLNLDHYCPWMFNSSAYAFWFVARGLVSPPPSSSAQLLTRRLTSRFYSLTRPYPLSQSGTSTTATLCASSFTCS